MDHTKRFPFWYLSDDELKAALNDAADRQDHALLNMPDDRYGMRTSEELSIIVWAYIKEHNRRMDLR